MVLILGVDHLVIASVIAAILAATVNHARGDRSVSTACNRMGRQVGHFLSVISAWGLLVAVVWDAAAARFRARHARDGAESNGRGLCWPIPCPRASPNA